MPEKNDDRTIHDWLRHIDAKLDTMDDNIQGQLNGKVDKEVHSVVEERVHTLEGKNGVGSHVKNAGGAAGIATLIVAVKAYFGG